MREVLRKWVCPPFLGAIYILALTLLFAQSATETDALGENGQQIVDFVQLHFATHIAHMKTAIALLSIAIGLYLGTVAGLLVETRRALRGAGESWGDLIHAFLLIVMMHTSILFWSMATWPALYSAAFYERGGARRALQIFATEKLGPAASLSLLAIGAVAYLLLPRTRFTRGRFFSAIAPATISASMIGCLFIALAWQPSQSITRHTPHPSKPNVLVLAADSLRADRFNASTMPLTYRFVEERGVVFESAYVSLPRTFPSWATILTGRYPHEHGIRSMFPTHEERDKDFDAMPARFEAAGYRSSVVSDFAGDIFSRIRFGFSSVDAPIFNIPEFVAFRAFERALPVAPFMHTWGGRKLFPSMRELHLTADPRDVTERAKAAMNRASASPFFLTAFYSTTHFPYASPAPYFRTQESYLGDLKYGKLAGLENASRPSEGDVTHLRALYDGAVRAVDASMYDLLHSLDISGELENTIVVITADHGETLYEGDFGAGHGDHLFGDNVIHVPLAFIAPGNKVGHVRELSADVDLAPTLYSLAQIAPPSGLRGVNLENALHGEAFKEHPIFAETGLWFSTHVHGVDDSLRLPYPPIEMATEVDPNGEMALRPELAAITIAAKHRMMQTATHKWVYMPTPTGPQFRVYDTATDRDDQHDLAGELSTKEKRRFHELTAWMLEDPALGEEEGRIVYRFHPPVPPARGLRIGSQ